MRCDVTYQFSTVLPANAPGGAAAVSGCLSDATAGLKDPRRTAHEQQRLYPGPDQQNYSLTA
ncbi:hypothetical protein [Streptomyces venezuelae]|uniref:hypothetical protein n=1 Tax=Streptomyces venezuelae TaxID=54571 RepID=UPI0037B37A54